MAGVVAPNAGKEVHTAWSDWYRGPPGQARYMPSLPVLRSARGLEDFVLQGWTASPNPSPNPNPNPYPNPNPNSTPNSTPTPNPDPSPTQMLADGRTVVSGGDSGYVILHQVRARASLGLG